jgi:hypothetical protein
MNRDIVRAVVLREAAIGRDRHQQRAPGARVIADDTGDADRGPAPGDGNGDLGSHFPAVQVAAASVIHTGHGTFHAGAGAIATGLALRMALESREDARVDGPGHQRERRGAVIQREALVAQRQGLVTWASAATAAARPREVAGVAALDRSEGRDRPDDAGSQRSNDTRKEWTMIAMAMHSDALTTMPATLAARCPGRWPTCARASDARASCGRRRPSASGTPAPPLDTRAASHKAMAA